MTAPYLPYWSVWLSSASDGDVRLAAITHPSASIHSKADALQYGRYGAVMAYSLAEPEGELPDGQDISEFCSST